MGRKNRNASRKIKRAHIEQAVATSDIIHAPTAAEVRQAEIYRDDIIHAESFTRATVNRVRQYSALSDMHSRGQITDDQFFAAQQIARVAEMIQRNASVQCASLEARVDYAGSAKDILVERLGFVRMEVAYSKWRTSIAMPRRMILDMVLEDRNLFVTARVYRVGWPKAKRLLREALDLWCELLWQARREIEQDDLDKAHMRACA